PGTEALPWQTINKAVGTAEADDTVWLKAGTYHEGVRYFAHSGEYYASQIRFITLAAFGNDQVVIDGTRKVEPSEWTLKEGTKNVFWLALPEDTNQVFVDGERLAESMEVGIEEKPDIERGADQTMRPRAIALTDETPGGWLYDENEKRLYINTGDGNPSERHLVEVCVNSFAIELQPRPGTKYEGRGVWNTAIRLRGLTFDRLQTGLEGHATFSVIEDCVVRYAGADGIRLHGMHNIIRRNTVLHSLHQGIYWGGNTFVLEDNLIVSAQEWPNIVDSDYEGVLKTNGGSLSTIRNNVIAEVRAGEHYSGGPGIWCDIASDYNAICGNVCYRQENDQGIWVEQTQNANVVAYNTCFENGTGIGVRANSFNLFLGNYLFNNRGAGLWFLNEERYPPMTAQRAEGNWLVNNGQGIAAANPTALGWNAESLDRNFYDMPEGSELVKWGQKIYTDLETLRKETGQEIHGKTGSVGEDEIHLIKFRVPHTSTPEMLVPMVANPTLLRGAISQASDHATRPYFWRQGDGSGLSFGVGAAGPRSITSGVIRTSYNNLPRIWAKGGSLVAGMVPLKLGSDGLPLESHEGPGEKRWGLAIQGTQPEDMHPLGEGWWSPTLPTVAGTKYAVSWASLADDLKPTEGDPKAGPVVFVQFTNDTGQQTTRQYLWGLDDAGQPHGELAGAGSYGWSKDGGEVTAPEGATRVAFFFGLRNSAGIIKYRDLYIEAK
ncbi:MAG: right-handed parallel beta-helix repeat-containing protein, partial [Planctomycetes bacterium]|nr:right-handed parallel beta-helix repeat-containing protein [Planctomycetota bacterium]